GRVRVRSARRGCATPEIDDHPPAEENAARGADLAEMLEVGGEGIANRLESGRDRALDPGLDHAFTVLLARCLSPTLGCSTAYPLRQEVLIAPEHRDLDQQEAPVDQS